MSFIDKGYCEYTEVISLFAGHANGEQNPLLKSIKNNLNYELESLERQISETNYFIFENDTKALISPHINKLKNTIHNGKVFYRSRIGYERKSTSLHGWGDEFHFEPNSKKAISAPSPKISNEEELIVKGFPFYIYPQMNQLQFLKLGHIQVIMFLLDPFTLKRIY